MQDSFIEKLKQPIRWVRSWFWVLYNGYPAKRVKVIGVTGTDGKTTTCWLIYEILKAAGKKVGMITTVGIKYIAGVNNDEYQMTNELHVTNPDEKVVQGLLKKMAGEGVEYVIIETTSHRLAQMKTVGYNTKIAVLTNLTREHLDYHGTMENYARAKLRLFQGVEYSILNKNDQWNEFFKSEIRNSKSETKILEYSKTEIQNISSSLAGEYNKYNVGAAQAVASILKIQEPITKDVVKNFKGVPGRREEIKNNLGIRMIVDFAHTPNALKQLLISLRNQSKSKIILVFGCTGERDKGKRPEMGLVAEKYADKVIVTADDPRNEDLGEIYEQIVSNSKFEIRNLKFIREDDRDKAIEMAVKMAKKGDTVVAAGMGHENTILIKGKEIKRSDRMAFENVSGV